MRFRKPGGASPSHIGSHLESQRREANRPLGICLVFWQNRLQDAVLEHSERPFFGFHFTHLGWLVLLMMPCILFLIVTADYSRTAEPDEDW